eukprot:SAG31_NODE_239_length_19453_cov_5.539888_4_plen_164_part_00
MVQSPGSRTPAAPASRVGVWRTPEQRRCRPWPRPLCTRGTCATHGGRSRRVRLSTRGSRRPCARRASSWGFSHSSRRSTSCYSRASGIPPAQALTTRPVCSPSYSSRYGASLASSNAPGGLVRSRRGKWAEWSAARNGLRCDRSAAKQPAQVLHETFPGAQSP